MLAHPLLLRYPPPSIRQTEEGHRHAAFKIVGCREGCTKALIKRLVFQSRVVTCWLCVTEYITLFDSYKNNKGKSTWSTDFGGLSWGPNETKVEKGCELCHAECKYKGCFDFFSTGVLWGNCQRKGPRKAIGREVGWGARCCPMAYLLCSANSFYSDVVTDEKACESFAIGQLC